MNDERIEPSIEHEYSIALTVEQDRETQQQMLVARVQTTREFTSFAYRIGLEMSCDLSKKEITLQIGGLSIPNVMMPSNGSAVSEERIVLMPAGSYRFTACKKARSISTDVVVTQMRAVNVVPVSNGFASVYALRHDS
jgi:hypothetical protein